MNVLYTRNQLFREIQNLFYLQNIFSIDNILKTSFNELHSKEKILRWVVVVDEVFAMLELGYYS